MKKAGVKSLPLYPEARESKMPTPLSIFRLFTFVDRESVFEDDNLIGVFEPELSDLQKQILELLGVPRTAYV
jgi:hypothetical protein